jgi:hypothetical protein
MVIVLIEEERYREVWERAQPNHKFVSFPFQKKSRFIHKSGTG